MRFRPAHGWARPCPQGRLLIGRVGSHGVRSPKHETRSDGWDRPMESAGRWVWPVSAGRDFEDVGWQGCQADATWGNITPIERRRGNEYSGQEVQGVPG